MDRGKNNESEEIPQAKEVESEKVKLLAMLKKKVCSLGFLVKEEATKS